MPDNGDEVVRVTRLVLDEVAIERMRQDAKWGQQNHDPFVWNTILLEEVGEAAKEILEGHFVESSFARNKRGYYQTARTELVQVAAVAVAMIESLDRNELKTSEVDNA